MGPEGGEGACGENYKWKTKALLRCARCTDTEERAAARARVRSKPTLEEWKESTKEKRNRFSTRECCWGRWPVCGGAEKSGVCGRNPKELGEIAQQLAAVAAASTQKRYSCVQHCCG